MGQPNVVKWFRVYVGVMAFVYLLCLGLGLFFLVDPDAIVDGSSSGVANREEALLVGAIYFAIGALGVGGHLLALFAPRRFWAWVYNLVVIALGMTSCCCLPVTIPLLIFWIKPETREWYRSGAGEVG